MHRFTSSGTHVRTYPELIEYLLTKSNQIHAVELDFDGRNVLLYSLGNVIQKADPIENEPKVTRGLATTEIWRNIQ